jgi:hypothetical protein
LFSTGLPRYTTRSQILHAHMGGLELGFFVLFNYIFSLILSFNILFSRNWASSFFYFSLSEFIVFSFNCFFVIRYDPSTFDLKNEFFNSILSFSIWLIENWSSCFFFSFLWGYLNLTLMIARLSLFDLGLFFSFFFTNNFFFSFALWNWVVW